MSTPQLARWQGLDGEALAIRWRVARVHPTRTVGSTNDLARRLAAEGAPDGTVVVAEEQTAGRGRAGRGWSSPAGLGLWFSALRRPEGGFLPGPLPIRAGIAAAAALDPFLDPGRASLKWPNDLFASGRKLGGVLCEAVWEGGHATAVIVGVGINVLHRPEDFPDEIRSAAGSVAIVASAEVSLLSVADAVIPAILAVSPDGHPLSEAERAAFEVRDALRGRTIVVTDPTTGEPRGGGTALGIAEDGSLRLRGSDDSDRAIHSGTVRLAGTDSLIPI